MIYQRIRKVLSPQAIRSKRRVEFPFKENKVFLDGQLDKIWMKLNHKFYCFNINLEKTNCQKFSSKFIGINKSNYLIMNCFYNNNRKTIHDLQTQQYKKDFYPIGGLAYHIRGLIQLINNGILCYQLSLSKFGLKKTFCLKTNDKFDQNSIKEWQTGNNLQANKIHPYKIRIFKDDPKFSLVKLVFKKGQHRPIRKVANLLCYQISDFKSTELGSLSLNRLNERDFKLIKAINFEDI